MQCVYESLRSQHVGFALQRIVEGDATGDDFTNLVAGLVALARTLPLGEDPGDTPSSAAAAAVLQRVDQVLVASSYICYALVEPRRWWIARHNLEVVARLLDVEIDLPVPLQDAPADHALGEPCGQLIRPVLYLGVADLLQRAEVVCVD